MPHTPRRSSFVLGALAVALLAAPADASDFGLAPPLVLPAGVDPRFVEVLDVTGDGLPDVVVGSGSGGEMRVFANLGAGAFAAPAVSSFTGPLVEWTFGDVDGDGNTDVLLLSGTFDTGNFVELLLGDGAGGFTPAGSPDVLLPGTHFGVDLVLTDLDEDGALDLVVAQMSVIRVALGDGGGGFAPPAVVESLESSWAVAVFDVDANTDGHRDVVVVSANSQLDWAVYLGDGSGALVMNPAPSEGTCVIGNRIATMGDLNGDHVPDVVISFTDFCLPDEVGKLQLGLSDGSTISGLYPEDTVFVPGSEFWSEIAVGDLDGDGQGEVLLTHDLPSFTDFRLLTGHGDGTFEPVQVVPAGLSPGAMRIADVDGDGVSDVVTLDRSAAAVAILHNTSLPSGWSSVGSGLAGTLGPPLLTGAGSLKAGEHVGVAVSGGLPGAPAWLVLGFGQVGQPFKGGVFVPTPDVVLGGLSLDASGDFAWGFTWPAEIPAATTLWWQMWIADVGGPQGFAATNGVASKAEVD